MLVSTLKDLTNAALAVANGKIEVKDIIFNEEITETIKIFSENFPAASPVDFRFAKIILAVQGEVLKTYNLLFGTSLHFKDLASHPFLIVEFNIENGCVELLQKIKKFFFAKPLEEYLEIFDRLEIFKNMSGTQKIIALFLIMLIPVSYAAPEIIRAIKSNPEIAATLEQNENLLEYLSKNQEVSAVIINNLGSGHIEYSGAAYTVKDYEEAKIKNPKTPPAPIIVSDEFFIQKYDFDKQEILVFTMGHESFWASTKWLTVEAREKLQQITSNAIARQTVAKERMCLSCIVQNHKIRDAIVQTIGDKQTGNACSFTEAVNSFSSRKMPFQGNLIE